MLPQFRVPAQLRIVSIIHDKIILTEIIIRDK